MSHKVYTLRELAERTAEVIDEVNEDGRSASITLHGRFVALLVPLVGVPVESMALRQGPIAEEIRRRAMCACSLTREWHVHQSGECPVHPDAPVTGEG